MTRTLTLLAALLLAASASAHQVIVGDLEIIHPNIPMPPAGAKSAAGYMAIANNGSETATLTGVSAAFAAKAQVHLSRTDANGVSKMEPVPSLEIPPGDTVLLEPGGYHVMFMGLSAPLTEGGTAPVTLTFGEAGALTIEFEIDPPGDHGMMQDHSAHGSGG